MRLSPVMARRRILWTLLALSLALIASGLVYGFFFKPTSVAVTTVQEGRLAPTLEVPGTVEARLEYTVGARIASTVSAMHVDQRDRVKVGQVLVELDDDELQAAVEQAEQALASARHQKEAAESRLEAARAELEQARRDHRRNRGSDQFVSAKTLDASETALRAARAGVEGARADLAAGKSEVNRAEAALREARTRLNYTRVKAKRPGLVIEREAEPGEAVQPGSPLLTLIDPDTLWVTARVDETVVGRVATGQSARIRLRSGASLPGEVVRVEPLSDPATRELEVDIGFRKPPDRIILREEARVAIRTGAVSGLIIPASAVVYREGQAQVLTVVDGHARAQQVRIAASEGDRALVEKGLEAGASVITAPAAVAAGDRVEPQSPAVP